MVQPHLATALLLLTGLMTCGSRSKTPIMGDEEARRLVRQAVVEAGWEGPVMIHQDEDTVCPGFGRRSPALATYVATQGGITHNDDYITISRYTPPGRWRVVVNRVTAEVYRIAGFPGQSEYGKLIEALDLRVSDAHSARKLARQFVRCSNARKLRIVQSPSEMQRVMTLWRMDWIGGREFRRCLAQWKRANRKAIESIWNGLGVRSVPGGYEVALAAVADGSGIGAGTYTELRRFRVEVTHGGALAMESDELVAVIRTTTSECDRTTTPAEYEKWLRENDGS